jgi:hypothetical protein
MDRHLLASGEADVGQEALVTTDQSPFDQLLLKSHDVFLSTSYCSLWGSNTERNKNDPIRQRFCVLTLQRKINKFHQLRIPQRTWIPIDAVLWAGYLSRMRVLLITGVVVGVVFAARAQESEPDLLASAGETGELEASHPEMEILTDKVPDNQKSSRSAQQLARMRTILTEVLEHLAEAREERDVVKLNCVNEKLTAIKGLLKISEQADVAMQEALARRNSEIAHHEFEKVAVAGTKCEQLFSESEACVGELAVYSGETEVELEVKEEPTVDLSEGGEATVEVITRPAPASPYQ